MKWWVKQQNNSLQTFQTFWYPIITTFYHKSRRQACVACLVTNINKKSNHRVTSKPSEIQHHLKKFPDLISYISIIDSEKNVFNLVSCGPTILHVYLLLLMQLTLSELNKKCSWKLFLPSKYKITNSMTKNRLFLSKHKYKEKNRINSN